MASYEISCEMEDSASHSLVLRPGENMPEAMRRLVHSIGDTQNEISQGADVTKKIAASSHGTDAEKIATGSHGADAKTITTSSRGTDAEKSATSSHGTDAVKITAGAAGLTYLNAMD